MLRKKSAVRISRLGRAIVEGLERRQLLSAGNPGEHLEPHLLRALHHLEEEAGPIAVSGEAPVSPSVPAVSGTVEGVDFNSDASTTGYYQIPPDNTMAAGPTH